MRLSLNFPAINAAALYRLHSALRILQWPLVCFWQLVSASSSARSLSVRSTNQRFRIAGALHRRRNASMPAGLSSVNYPVVIH